LSGPTSSVHDLTVVSERPDLHEHAGERATGLQLTASFCERLSLVGIRILIY
jgi:hypothetical protein